MGSFLGHLVPGTFFVLFSLRWLFVSLSTFYNLQKKKRSSNNEEKNVFKATTTFPCCYSMETNHEAWFKLICCAIGIIGEFITGFNSEWKFVNYGNTQHMTMFFFFGINGIVEIIMTKDEARNRLIKSSESTERSNNFSRLPPGTDYLSVLIAVFIEGLLFFFHLHGRTPLDVHVHQLLIISIFVTFVSVANEWKHKNNILAVIFRSICFLLQGTWFVQVGFILYNPLPGAVSWADHDHVQMMLVTTLFCGHLAFAILVAASIGYWTSKSNCVSYHSSGASNNTNKNTYQNVPYCELPVEVASAE